MVSCGRFLVSTRGLNGGSGRSFGSSVSVDSADSSGPRRISVLSPPMATEGPYPSIALPSKGVGDRSSKSVKCEQKPDFHSGL